MTRKTVSGGLLLPLLYVIIAMASVQSGASLAKRLFPLFGATGTVALRIVFGALILTVIMRPWQHRIRWSEWRSLALYGAALAGMNISFYLALYTIPLGIAVALEFTGPLCVAFYHSRRLLDLFWILLAVAGLMLMLPIGFTPQDIDPTGAAFALVAGAFWGLYIVFGQKAGSEHGMQATALGMIAAAAIAFPTGAPALAEAPFTPLLVFLAIGVAILSSVVPYTLEMAALRRLAPHTFGILMSLEPAVATLSGFFFLNETLSTIQMLAILLIVFASIGTTVTSRTKAPDTSFT